MLIFNLFLHNHLLQEDTWDCQNEMSMFVEVKEENTLEGCSYHSDATDNYRLDVILTKCM
jgi:hypothetical protein